MRLGKVPRRHRPTSRTVTITNERGLHARAAAMFVKLAGRFDAQVTVSRRGQTVSGLSILGLMMLGAVRGSRIKLNATGAEAGQAIDALYRMIKANFEED